jgi:penicillin-binding protein 1C
MPSTPTRRTMARRRRIGLAAMAAAALLGFLAVPVVTIDRPLSTALVDRDGRLLGAVTADDGQWRFGVPDAVPAKFRCALLLFEDRRFAVHPGVDPLAVARAAWQNLRARRVVSGGSTITQQVVRMARPGRPRSFVEKAIEMVLALRLEAASSKDRILALYAGHAPFGGNVVGLEAASWRYFGRPPGDLSWAEAATLAVLPNNPAVIHPGRNRSHLKARRDHLLERLHRSGAIDAETFRLACAEGLPEAPLPMPALTPHLLQRARAEVPPRRRGVVATTLVYDWQRRAVAIAEDHRRRLAGNGVANLAVLVADVTDGTVRAYVGNVGGPGGATDGRAVDVITAPRSSGSILKPFLFAALLEAGEILPDELVADIPTRISGFAPQNFDRSFAGAVPASVALSRSLNVPAVRMLRGYGIDRFSAFLRRLGVTTLTRTAEDYGLSLILGGAEVTLWDMTALYAGLGRVVEQAHTDDDLGPSFRELAYHSSVPPTGDRGRGPIGPGAAFATLQALTEVARPGIDSAWRSFASSHHVAWKTGTSVGFRDAWAIGVTPEVVVGVWAGNADGEGRPGLTGHAAAAPILFEVLDAIPAGRPFEAPQAAMAEVVVCRRSGLRAGRDCAERRAAVVPCSSLPGRVCTYCRLVHLDATRPLRVHDGCEAVSAMRPSSVFVLPAAMARYYTRHHPDYRPLPAYRDDCRPTRPATEERPMTVIYPQHRAEVYVPRELDGARGRLVAEAAHRDPEAPVFWHLDERYLGRTRGEHRMALAPEPGEHRLTLTDGDGVIVRRLFTVLGGSAGG